LWAILCHCGLPRESAAIHFSFNIFLSFPRRQKSMRDKKPFPFIEAARQGKKIGKL
jgi:hypothetical protein